MGKTFADLRNTIAAALGYAYDDLDAQDQADVDTIINAAYLDCYAAKDGRRPSWATQYWSEIVKAPATATLGLTQGSTAVTGFAFEAKYVGSFVKVGDSFYRLGSVAAGPTYALSQPWAGETGSFSATIYYNAVAMPGRVVKVVGVPSLIGIGPLVPIPFPEGELEMRSTPTFDFEPKSARAPFAFSRPRFDPSLITDVGDPRYFHIDSAAPGATFATSSRFHLYPLPGGVFTIDLRAIIIPPAMTAGTDVPVLPHDEDIDIAGAIMLPLAFERMLKHPIGRRYSGQNMQLILMQGKEAREQLNTFRSVQQSGPKMVRVSRSW
jgi:hypothetical protein